LSLSIEEQVAKLGDGPLTEAGLREHVWPLFTRALAGDRERGEIYLANHSLGRPPDRTAEDVAHAMDIWYRRMDECWEGDGWLAERERFRSRIARLIGLSDPTCIVPKASAGQGLRAVLNALPRDGSLRPLRVVATLAEFDSVDFILRAYEEKRRAEVAWVEPAGTSPPNPPPRFASQSAEGGQASPPPSKGEEPGVRVPIYDAESVIRAITPGTDLVAIWHIAFGTGQLMPGLEQIVQAAHAAGALILIDAFHSAGVIPVEFEEIGADFMVGGCYKYCRGGAGACWLAIHPCVLESGLKTLDTGWFAKRAPLAFERPDAPLRASGGDGWLESTPAVLPFFQAAAGLDVLLALGVQRLRAYNLAQQATMRVALREEGVPCFEPADPEAFGAFSLVPAKDAHACRARLKEAGLNVDARGDFLRFGPDFVNTDDELRKAARITASNL
jgi:kynureninase